MPPVSFENTLQRACVELESLAELLAAEQSEIATATQSRIEELTQEKRRRLESLQLVLAIPPTKRIQSGVQQSSLLE